MRQNRRFILEQMGYLQAWMEREGGDVPQNVRQAWNWVHTHLLDTKDEDAAAMEVGYWKHDRDCLVAELRELRASGSGSDHG